MIKKIFKWFCVVSFVLLIGQVSIGSSDTVGSWYQKQVVSLVIHVANEVKNTKVFSNLVQAKGLEPATVTPIPTTNVAPLPRVQALKPKPAPTPKPSPTPTKNPTLKQTSLEEVTQSDREQLMRLLK